MNKRAQSPTTIIVTVVLILIATVVASTLVSDRTELFEGSQTLSYTSANTLETFTLDPVGQELRTSTFTLEDGNTTLTSPADYNVTTDGSLSVDYGSTGNLSSSWQYEKVGYTTGITSTVISFVTVFVALLAILYISGFF